jgi:hypothetical protein
MTDCCELAGHIDQHHAHIFILLRSLAHHSVEQGWFLGRYFLSNEC